MPDRFSVQQGIVAPPSLGLKEASEELRTAFYNWCALTFLIRDDGRWYSRCQVLWNFMHRPLDEMPLTPYDTQRHLKLYLIREAHWWQFYDFVQFIPYVLSSENFARRQTRAELNDLLANEGSAYRFVEDSLAPVVAPVEAEEVEKALHSPVAAVGVQIADALAKLSARPHPDVRNSIKESISAVESALKEWAHFYEILPRIDVVFVPGGDPGHTEPRAMLAFLDRVARQSACPAVRFRSLQADKWHRYIAGDAVAGDDGVTMMLAD